MSNLPSLEGSTCPAVVQGADNVVFVMKMAPTEDVSLFLPTGEYSTAQEAQGAIADDGENIVLAPGILILKYKDHVGSDGYPVVSRAIVTLDSGVHGHMHELEGRSLLTARAAMDQIISGIMSSDPEARLEVAKMRPSK